MNDNDRHEILKQDDCKACHETVRLSEDEIKQIFGDTVKVKNVKLVTEETFSNRMKLCRECDALLYNTTCKHCGCIVQIKGKLLNSKCPYPYNTKW